MRDFLISTISENPNGSQLVSLLDYHFEGMPTIKEIREEFLKSKPGQKNVAVISIMEFNKLDYEKLLSEQ